MSAGHLCGSPHGSPSKRDGGCWWYHAHVLTASVCGGRARCRRLATGLMAVTNKSVAAYDGAEQTCVLSANITTTPGTHDVTPSMYQWYAASPFDPMVVGLVRLALYMLTARRCLSFLLP
jgi:hypothetical protein